MCSQRPGISLYPDDGRRRWSMESGLDEPGIGVTSQALRAYQNMCPSRRQPIVFGATRNVLLRRELTVYGSIFPAVSVGPEAWQTGEQPESLGRTSAIDALLSLPPLLAVAVSAIHMRRRADVDSRLWHPQARPPPRFHLLRRQSVRAPTGLLASAFIRPFLSGCAARYTISLGTGRHANVGGRSITPI